MARGWPLHVVSLVMGLAMAAALAGCTLSGSNRGIVGAWRGTVQGRRISMNFAANGHWIFSEGPATGTYSKVGRKTFKIISGPPAMVGGTITLTGDGAMHWDHFWGLPSESSIDMIREPPN